jgi:hypothetical protein
MLRQKRHHRRITQASQFKKYAGASMKIRFAIPAALALCAIGTSGCAVVSTAAAVASTTVSVATTVVNVGVAVGSTAVNATTTVVKGVAHVAGKITESPEVK